MTCPACTSTVQCVSCCMEGRPAPRVRKYTGRLGRMQFFVSSGDAHRRREPDDDGRNGTPLDGPASTYGRARSE